MIREYQQLLNRLFVILDVLVLVVSLIFTWWLRFKSGVFVSTNHLAFEEYLQVLVFLVPGYLLASYVFDLYSPGRRRAFTKEFINVFKANLVTAFLVMAALFFIKEVHYSRTFLLILFTVNFVLMTFFRLVLRVSLKLKRAQGLNQKFILVIGAGSLGQTFVQRINQHKEFGYQVLGYVDDGQDKQGRTFSGVPVIGKIDDLEDIVQRKLVDEVILALPLNAYPKLHQIMNICEKYGLKALIIPDYYDYIPARPKIDELDGIPLINTRHVPLSEPLNKLGKRIFDIVFSLIILLMLSPLLLVIALGVKLSSPGPMFYKQERVGLNRRPIFMYKFRSMRIAEQGEDKTSWSSKDDPRKTKFGDFIRRTSLDELPQFWNVLVGDMSVIGPRPERPHFVEQFKESIPKYMIKHQVRPGITGWAQVNGWRGDTSIEERIKCDLYYVENWSWALDLKIIVMTILKGFINKNAY